MSQNFFVAQERAAQSNFFTRTVPAEAMLGDTGYRLKAAHRLLNFVPLIRKEVDAYFGPSRNIACIRMQTTGYRPRPVVSTSCSRLR
jgi:hypothetical protein